MSIISNILATIPAAPAGGSRVLTIRRDLSSGIDFIYFEARYTYSDGTIISHTEKIQNATNSTDITNWSQGYTSNVTSIVNLLTI